MRSGAIIGKDRSLNELEELKFIFVAIELQRGALIREKEASEIQG